GTKSNLTPVRVSAKHQIYSCTSSTAQNNWIVGEQEFHFVIAGSGESQRNVFETDHGIVDSCEPERRAVLFKTHAFINQISDSFGAKQVSDQRTLGPTI